jgi:hypothetical protein
VGGERQSLIDVELKRTEFRLDVLKLREQLASIGVGHAQTKKERGPTVVTTREGSVVEAATATSAAAAPKPEPAPAGRS